MGASGNSGDELVDVVAADGDEPSVARIRAALEGLELHPSSDVVVVVVSEHLVLDARAVDHALRRIARGLRVIPALVRGLPARELPEEIAGLHGLRLEQLDDAALAAALQAALTSTPEESHRLRALLTSAILWDEQGRPTRSYLPPRTLASSREVLQNFGQQYSPPQAALVHDFLQATAEHGGRRRRLELVVAGAVVSVLAVAASVGLYTLGDTWSTARRAGEAAERQRATDLGQSALGEFADGNERGALQHALSAMSTASTPVSRLAARSVLSVPLPSLVVSFGARITAVAWTASGRYLVVAWGAGNLSVLDPAADLVAKQLHPANEPITELVVEDGKQSVQYRTQRGVSSDVDLGVRDSGSGTGQLRDSKDTSLNADGTFRAIADQDGVVLARTSCAVPVNGTCMTWVRTEHLDRGLWAPRGAVLAVVSDAVQRVSIIKADQALAGSLASPEGQRDLPIPTATPWAGLLVGKGYPVVVRSPGDQRPAPACPTAVTPQDAERADVVRGYDCRGRLVWSVRVSDIVAALPPTARVFDGRRPTPMTAIARVAPTGRGAFVLDLNGVVHLFDYRGQKWLETAHLILPGDLIDVRGIAFSPGSDVGALAIAASGSQSPAKAVVMDVGAGKLGLRDLPSLGEDLQLITISTDGSTAVIGSATALANPVELVRLKPGSSDEPANQLYGSPLAYDSSGTRLLTLGGAVDGSAWPSTLPAPVDDPQFSPRVTVARVYDTATGELLCQVPFYQPESRVALVAPDLSGMLVDFNTPILYQRLCTPVEDPLAALRELDRRFVTVK